MRGHDILHPTQCFPFNNNNNNNNKPRTRGIISFIT